MVLFGRSVYYLLASAGVDHGSKVYPVGCEVAVPLEQRIGACGFWGLPRMQVVVGVRGLLWTDMPGAER